MYQKVISTEVEKSQKKSEYYFLGAHGHAFKVVHALSDTTYLDSPDGHKIARINMANRSYITLAILCLGSDHASK